MKKNSPFCPTFNVEEAIYDYDEFAGTKAGPSSETKHDAWQTSISPIDSRFLMCFAPTFGGGG